jgi:hypothetical protein
MRVELEASELPVLIERLGLPTDTIREQVEEAVLATLTGERPLTARQAAPAPRRQRQDDPDCERAIAAAIAAEKITPARAEHYRHRWERDPTGTAGVLARLASVPGLNTAPAPTAADQRAYPTEWLAQAERPRRSRVTTED